MLVGAERFPAVFLLEPLRIVEEEIHAAEIEELDEILESVSDLVPPIVRDACRHRIRGHSGESVVVERAEEGGVTLLGSVSALAYWLVEKALAEVVKDAYALPRLHQRLGRLVAGRVARRHQELARRLELRFRQPVLGARATIELEPVPARTTHVLRIVVRVQRDAEIPPRPSQLYPPSEEGGDERTTMLH